MGNNTKIDMLLSEENIEKEKLLIEDTIVLNKYIKYLRQTKSTKIRVYERAALIVDLSMFEWMYIVLKRKIETIRDQYTNESQYYRYRAMANELSTVLHFYMKSAAIEELEYLKNGYLQKTQSIEIYLPYEDFQKSLECMDVRTLGNQRIESFQLIKTLVWDEPKTSYSSPVEELWKNHTIALVKYYNMSVDLWKEKGFKNTFPKITNFKFPEEISLPECIGNSNFHRAYQIQLLKENRKHYENQFPI